MAAEQIGQIGLTEFCSKLDERLTNVEKNGGGGSGSGQNNVLEKIQVNGEEQEIVNKTVNIKVPVKTSELENDSDFQTQEGVSETVNTVKTQLQSQINQKQDTLESGVNIKSVNGISLLGRGNLVVGDAVCTICTREEYDALTEYDSNTIYFIRG